MCPPKCLVLGQYVMCLQEMALISMNILLVEENLVQKIQRDVLTFFACMLIRKDLHSCTSPSLHAIDSSILTSRINKYLRVPGLGTGKRVKWKLLWGFYHERACQALSCLLSTTRFTTRYAYIIYICMDLSFHIFQVLLSCDLYVWFSSCPSFQHAG